MEKCKICGDDLDEHDCDHYKDKLCCLCYLEECDKELLNDWGEKMIHTNPEEVIEINDVLEDINKEIKNKKIMKKTNSILLKQSRKKKKK